VLLKDIFDYRSKRSLNSPAPPSAASRPRSTGGRLKLAASSKPATSRREVSPELSRLLHLYIDRFNKRDWEGLRKLISADARLRVADRFVGSLDESPYFGNYERQTVPWRLAVAELDGELAVIALRQYGDEWRPSSVVRLQVTDQHISHIADYAHCPWVLSTAASVVVAQPSGGMLQQHVSSIAPGP